MKSKLLFFLKNLDKKEQKRFFEYARSPFFNKNKKILALVSFFERYGPDFSSTKLTSQNAFASVYGNITFDELKFNNLTSDLMQLLYDFLAYQMYESASSQKVYWVGKSILDKDLSDKMKPIFKRFDLQRKKNTYQDAPSLMMEMKYHELKDEWIISDGKRGYSHSLVQKKELLEQYYFLKQLEIACDMVSRNSAIQADYDTSFIEEIETQFERWKDQPAVVIYYTALKVLTGKSTDQNYFHLKQLLADNPDIFPKDELRTLYNFALNFCVKQINSGYGNYYEEVLSLYKILLQQRIIYKNGYISQWTFTNICTAGMRLGQFDWTSTFIERYQGDLLPANKMNVVNYNIAALYYAEKNWEEALQLLQSVIFTDAYYQAAAKTIQLKIYYESGEQEALRALIDSFGKFIMRNKQLSTYQKKSNKNFLSLTFKLLKIKDRKGLRSTQLHLESVSKILEKIKETHPISNKNWVLNQANGLLEGNKKR